MTDNQKNILPKHWDTKKLEDLISYAIGGDWGKDENYQDADYDFAYCIRGSELKNWKEEKGKSASLRKIKKSNIIKRKLRVGDILVEISGGGPEQPVGRTVVIDQSVLDFESHITKICTNFFRLIRPIEDVDSSFLNFYLNFFYFSGEIGKFQSGSNNLRNLKFPDYLKLQIPLPPLPEQQKIVLRIECLLAELETGINALKTALAQIKIYRQAVLNHFLTNDEWELVRLKEVNLFITDGDHQAPPKAEKGIPFVVISNIKNNKLDLSKTRFVTNEYYENLSEYRKPQKGDILYTVTGSYGIPVLLISEEKFCFQRHIGLLKPNTDKINREYLFYCLCSQFVFKQATDVATGTAQLTVPLSGLRNIKIPLPSLKIQTQIVSEIEKRMAGADALEASLKAQLINAENLRQSILKSAFEGKLV